MRKKVCAEEKPQTTSCAFRCWCRAAGGRGGLAGRSEARPRFPRPISARGKALGCKAGEVGAGPPCARPAGPRGAAASVARRGWPVAAAQRAASRPSPLVPFQAAWLRRLGQARLPGALAACRPLSPSPHALPVRMGSARRASLWVPAFTAPDLSALGPACFQAAEDHRITESQNSRGWKGPLWVI